MPSGGVMKATVKWVEEAMFVGASGSGHALVMDGPPDGGGKNLGMRPMELLLIGSGGCTAYDVVQILRKSRQQVTDCQVELSAERSDDIPKVFTRIHIHYTVSGYAIKPAVVERAIKLTAEKYCSASIMLGQMAEITHEFEIVDLAQN